MLKSVTFRSTLIALVCAVSVSAHAMADTPRKVDVPAGELTAALRVLAEQAGVEFVYSADQLKGVHTNGVHGEFTAEKAVMKLLEGTKLKLTVRDSGALLISDNRAQPGPTELTTAEGPVELEEVVVTGTMIRGATPASPVITLNREAIDATGYGTLAEVIRTVPQNFGGGMNPATVLADPRKDFSNQSFASSPNLRGLGTDATLTLIDGHRFAYSGQDNGVDISMIPAAAVERIEIVPDGASALYGSDAVAGVVNFVLRKDYDGAQTSLREAGASRNGGTETQVQQTLGKSWGDGGAIVSYEHYQQDALGTDQRPFSSGADGPTDLLPQQRKNSALLAIHQSIAPSASVHATALYTDRAASSAYNFFGDANSIQTTTRQYGGEAGVDMLLPRSWRLSLDANASRDGWTSVGDESFLGGPHNITTLSVVNRLHGAEVTASGPVATLPSGDISLAVGSGWRHEDFSLSSGNQSGSRSIWDAFAEILVPFFQPGAGRPWRERLDLSASVRYENYSSVGSATTPKIGLRYQPNSDFTVRGTWGKSFRAPTLLEQYGSRNVNAFDASFYVEPAPAGSMALFVNGANRALVPETSKSWTAGVDYTPAGISGLTLQSTYFSIDYANRIGTPITSFLGVYNNPTYAPFVIKNPNAALVNSYLANSDRQFLSPGFDPSNVYFIVLANSENAFAQSIDGVDFSISYRMDGAFGHVTLKSDASWLRVTQQDTSSSAPRPITGRIYEPSTVSGRAGVSWERDAWSGSLFVSYVDGEVDDSGPYVTGGAATNVRIASFTTFDVQGGYTVPSQSGPLRGIKVSLSAQNIFDRQPPRADAGSTFIPGLGFDPTKASPLGRFVSVSITKNW